MACEKPAPGDKPLPEPIPDGLEWISFGAIDGESTKALDFNWKAGDQLTIYSLRGDAISYTYSGPISNAAGNTCKIAALVDKQATGYLAVYPSDGLRYVAGDSVNTGSDIPEVAYNIQWPGGSDFREVSIMTCWAQKRDRDLYFKQRLSLLQVRNMIGDVKGSITKTTHTASGPSVRTNSINLRGYQSWYIPISSESGTVDIVYTTTNYKRSASGLEIYPGKCWVIQYTID